MERFIRTLESDGDLPMEFDDNTSLAVTDRITVFSDGHLEFTFFNGATFTTQL